MALGLVGRKCGMTRVFTEDGMAVPVTVVAIENNRITQLKTVEQDGYCAVQVTAGSRRASRVNKPSAGQFAKAGVEAGHGLWEFRVEAKELENLGVGKTLEVGYFQEGQMVDVRGTSKGKGFAGAVKRHNFRTQDASHGNSLSHRTLGSVGHCQTPGKVFPGRKMAGQLGNARATVQSLKVVRVDSERGLLLIKGAVPGAVGNNVIVLPAVKAKGERHGA